ncbi:hypothetical protein I302_102417 [Kwoniella bestiolae CBS 10118]|uniref:Zn(2)-C6 fungal-type domain-containing protein n=1 Tax=Kwoniella bestiolae CBS 10118 TaxID=1296100 RepID=A0AAJ8K3V0_9TREE
MVYTTACDRCRKIRMKCERPSRGQNQDEVCQRCRADDAACITKKRRVGRQPGVKNRKTREAQVKEKGPYYQGREPQIPRDHDNLPNPLQVLASEAVRRQSTPESDATMTPTHPVTYTRDGASILDRYSEWTSKIHGITGRGDLAKRLDVLLSADREEIASGVEDPSSFSGRTDMARPDAAPEYDVISLQVISLPEAQRLFDAFMKYLTNGSMYFDPQIHSLPFVRSRSSFLLSVILATASTYSTLCSSSLLHSQLAIHANRMVSYIRDNNLKSIEIVQGLLLLASWIEIPHTLSRDRTWAYVSYATALAVELRLDSPLPYCVQTDPIYSRDIHDLLVRNAHRVCLLLYIHDRNMAMVAGRYPIFPESTVTSQANLDKWGKHERACRYDAPICASVSLRKIIVIHHKLATHSAEDFQINMNLIERAITDWRSKWAIEITSTLEYGIIAMFSTFVLALTLLKKDHDDDKDDVEARKACEDLAFEVCCASINSYKSWTGILNSATFDTSMVAFCAIYTLQSINRCDPIYLSDWSVFRLATLQELVSELEKQAAVRHHIDKENSMSVVDAMARQLSRGIKLVLTKKQLGRQSIPSESSSISLVYNPEDLLSQQPGIEIDVNGIFHQNNNVGGNIITHSIPPQSQEQLFPVQEPRFDDLTQLLSSNNAIPFIPDWNLESLLPDANFNWDHINHSNQDTNSNVPFFDFGQ